MKKVSELDVGRVLLAGVLVSALIVLVGGILYLMQHGTNVYINPKFNHAVHVVTVQNFFEALYQLQAKAIILFGIIILMVTQLIRVMLTAWLFASHREYFFAWVSVNVFVMLIFCIVIAQPR